MMKQFKLVCKGTLLYLTTFITLLWISIIDIIYDNGYFIQSILIIASLIYICYKTISEEEFKILTFNRFFDDEEDNKA